MMDSSESIAGVWLWAPCYLSESQQMMGSSESIAGVRHWAPCYLSESGSGQRNRAAVAPGSAAASVRLSPIRRRAGRAATATALRCRLMGPAPAAGPDSSSSGQLWAAAAALTAAHSDHSCGQRAVTNSDNEKSVQRPYYRGCVVRGHGILSESEPSGPSGPGPRGDRLSATPTSHRKPRGL